MEVYSSAGHSSRTQQKQLLQLPTRTASLVAYMKKHQQYYCNRRFQRLLCPCPLRVFALSTGAAGSSTLLEYVGNGSGKAAANAQRKHQGRNGLAVTPHGCEGPAAVSMGDCFCLCAPGAASM